jgi:ATP-dependent Clp protease ATP-binding subunit ClpB
VKKGYDPVYGTRPLRRAVERYVETPLSGRILRGEYADGDRILADAGEEGLTFNLEKGSKAAV